MLDPYKDISKYSAAFTAGALLYNEILAVLPLLKEENAIELLNQEAQENKLLRIKTQAARTRVVTEIKRRIHHIPHSFWELLETCSDREQKLGLFYLILRSYPLVFDFQFEVVLKKWKSLDYTLERFDLQMRLDEIASRDKEVEQWSESTKIKLLTVFIRMLREVGLLGRTKLKKPEGIAPSFWQNFKTDAPWFLEACFLNKSEREDYL